MKLTKQQRNLVYIIMREEMEASGEETFFGLLMLNTFCNGHDDEQDIRISKDLPELNNLIMENLDEMSLDAKGKKMRLSILDTCIQLTEY
jgi:hypothetical protein